MKVKQRPSPTDSATLFSEGTIKTGNDGKQWVVTKNVNNVKRWTPLTTTRSTIVAASTGNSMTQFQTNVIPKFKVGDVVKIIKHGAGCADTAVGNVCTITEVGWYLSYSQPGYKIDNLTLRTNTQSGNHGGFIGETSFELVPTNFQNQQTKPLNIMNKNKTITKRKAQEIRTIETSLINKEEVFRMLALAESTGLPLLLVGEPGVAKTKTIIEYAKAWLNKDGKMTPQDFANKIYILETDEGTKASEIKGMPDLTKLFTQNTFELNAPIADAEIVIINEVDKASSAIRNAMLGVMNEKFLFNGKHKIPCKWKLFVATCNEIPKDEANSPFWDRFMLKMTVGRVSAGEMSRYYQKGARNYRESFKIDIPTSSEIDQVEIPLNKLDKYLEIGFQGSSDRTLTFVPKLCKAVSYVWDISIDKALVKTAQIMIGQSAGSELQNKLMSPEVKAVMSKVEMLQSHTTNEALELAIGEIEALINAYTSRGTMDASQVEEVENTMTYILQNHPARKEYAEDLEFDEQGFDPAMASQ